MMAGKRKRNRPSAGKSEEVRKRLRRDVGEIPCNVPIKHPALCLYYPHIVTLREYLRSRLLSSSRSRRRKLASVGLGQAEPHGIDLGAHAVDAGPVSNLSNHHISKNPELLGSENDLALLLDSTLVGFTHDPLPEVSTSREKDFAAFSQKATLTAGSSFGEGSSSQSEIVDFAIWLLFHRIYRNVHKPVHLICHGYQRANTPRQSNEDHCALATIPGIVSHYPNSLVSTIKSAKWADMLRLLGKEGERIMLDLVLDCGIFMAVDSGKGNYYQLCGVPLTEMPPLATVTNSKPAMNMELPTQGQRQSKPKCQPYVCKSPTAITFVRNRMFYARAALNAKGKVRFGLRHIHVLNRYGDASNPTCTVHLLKYIFPRQFGLHNAFTSFVDSRETVQPFKDYTLREQEISQIERQNAAKRSGNPVPSNKHHLPKRLRGVTYELVKKLQKLHSQCSYTELLKHYCPIDLVDSPRREAIAWNKGKANSSNVMTQASTGATCTNPASSKYNHSIAASQKSLVDFSTPPSDVSAFCRAALLNTIPNGFWGDGEDCEANKNLIMHNLDRFVKLRRFESMSLHTVSQGLKITTLLWLAPLQVSAFAKASRSDILKRKEILLEFLYYVFDSLLVPLIRSNFHVTESNVHRNRIFYFRHDVWRQLTEPALATLKLTMLEEIETIEARKLLDARPLGFSQLRLLPKGNGIRPIMNLRRRVTKLQHGKVVLGRSINSVMAPVFNMLDYEKRKQPKLMGSTIFSVGEMYPKLKAFREHLTSIGAERKPFYFAKGDVQSCFDTIPQGRVVRLMESIASEKEYRIARHAEIKSADAQSHGPGTGTGKKPARKFVALARAASDFRAFDDVVKNDLAMGRRNTVFVDTVVKTSQNKEKMLDLLAEHVERNVVKIGKKFFRQKAGIPQGSVLSGLLCNYFYAELEKEHFDILKEGESILLRLVDDFLLITTNQSHARYFLQIMHNGIEKYGVRVNPAKSLANFEVTINDELVPRLTEGAAFPYCGNVIDTRTLEISKDRDRRKDTMMADTLTVEPSKVPGKAFSRKALNAFKIQTHKMFLDTTFNSLATVLSNLYQNFVESAMKYYRYVKCMAANQQPRASLMISTIQDLMNLAFILIKAKFKDHSPQEYSCTVSKRQVQWLAAKAFLHVLVRKQNGYRKVIDWLEEALAGSAPPEGKEAAKLGRAVKAGDRVFRDFKY